MGAAAPGHQRANTQNSSPKLTNVYNHKRGGAVLCYHPRLPFWVHVTDKHSSSSVQPSSHLFKRCLKQQRRPPQASTDGSGCRAS
ncbi:hypothetical protein CHARACLAT_015248 [Characodon lateralis]|uniref:Uncharacterized protein n=1 Tax=Characodon lateralis TaxID=208331 RepID=A0ABU7ELZ0_9TELE|nr:hypothetical protein [Characodon lateralis]